MLANVQPDADQRVHQHLVVGDEILGVEQDLARRRIAELLAGDIAGAPVVGDPCGRDQAEVIAIAHLERCAAGDVGRKVDRQGIVLLQRDQVQRHDLPGQFALRGCGQIVNPRGAADCGLQGTGKVTVAIVEAEGVEAAAEIGEAVLQARFGVAAARYADGQECFGRDRLGGQVDHTAAEFAREIGRIGFLHDAGGDHAGRENVERDDAAQRFGAGQRKAVQQRQ